MKSNILVFCLAVSMVNCGKLRTQRILEIKKTAGDNSGIEVPAQTQYNFKLPELQIAKRLCNSLLAKRKYLESIIISTPPTSIAYNLTLEIRNCKAAVVESANLTAQIVLVGNYLEFTTNESSNYLKDVITDRTPGLAHICSEVFNTATPNLENKIISNAVVIQDKIYFVNLATDDKNFDRFQINSNSTNANGSLKTLNITNATIFTDVSQVVDPRNLGVEKERIQKNTCAGAEFSTTKETFVRSVFL
jgi:hypothetical protein